MKRNLFSLRGLYVLVLLMMFVTGNVIAQTMSGTGTKAWFGATNWTSPSSQPTTNSNVIINPTGSLIINMNSVGSVTLASFTVQGTSDSGTMNSSGTATITTNALTINRSFSFGRPFILTGVGTVASGKTLTCGADLTLNSGAALTINGTLANSSNTITVKSGAVLIFGSSSNPPSGINVEAGGEVRFIGSGSVTGLTSSNIYGKVSFQGTRSGASGFNATYLNGSTLEYKGTSAQTAYYHEMKSTGISNIIIDNSSGVTFASSLPPSPSINGTLTLVNGVLNFGDNVSSKMIFTGSNPITRTNGSINASGTYASLIFNNVSGNFTLPNNLFNNTSITRLQVNMQTTGTLTLNNQNLTVSQLLLTKGHLAVGSGNLTFGGVNTTFGTSTLNSNSMVVTPNAGYLCYSFPVGETSPVIFPLGETTGTTEYSPLTLGFANNSVTRTVGFKIADGVYANTGSVSDYLSRYFTMYTSSTSGTYDYSLTTKYNGASGDVVGIEASIQPAVYHGGTWNLYPGAINSALDQVEYISATETTGPIGSGHVYMGRYVTEIVTATIWYLDADNDGYYVDTQISSSSPGIGWTSTEGVSGDCNDNNPNVWRTAFLYVDVDNDGYTEGELQAVCYGISFPSGYSLTSLGGDCDDSNAAVNPGVQEICWNNVDDDCDGLKSEGCAPVVVNMQTANNYQLPAFSTAVAAVPYSFVGASSLGYRFTLTNNQTGEVREIYRDIRFLVIPGDMRNYNATYTVTAAAVINGEDVPYVGNTITVLSPPTIQKVSLLPALCGSMLSSLTETITSSIGLNAVSYSFRARLTSDTSSSPEYFYTPPSTRFTKMNEFVGLLPTYSTSYTIDVSYDFIDVETGLQVSSGYGESCEVMTPSMPTIKMLNTFCGGSVTRLTEVITANSALYATQYQFRIRLTSDNGSTPNYHYTLASASRFSTLSSFQGLTLEYNTSYTLSARYMVSNNGVDSWSDYGQECVVSTPSFPTTEVTPSLCGGNHRLDQTLTIVAYPNFPVYRVTLYEQVGEDLVPVGSPITRTVSNFKLNMFTGATTGKDYTVRVAIQLNGVFGLEGRGCDISTYPIVSVMRTGVQPLSVVSYPNPFTNGFNLELITSDKSSLVSVVVYDMIGRQVEQKELGSMEANEFVFGTHLPTGVYNVIVTQEEQTKAVRVIKR